MQIPGDPESPSEISWVDNSSRLFIYASCHYTKFLNGMRKMRIIRNSQAQLCLFRLSMIYFCGHSCDLQRTINIPIASKFVCTVCLTTLLLCWKPEDVTVLKITFTGCHLKKRKRNSCFFKYSASSVPDVCAALRWLCPVSPRRRTQTVMWGFS